MNAIERAIKRAIKRDRFVRAGALALTALTVALAAGWQKPALARTHGAGETATNEAAPRKKADGVLGSVRRFAREFRVYYGDRVERVLDRRATGRSTFQRGESVSKNLDSLVAEKGLSHYYADLGGRKVLHIVVDLAKGDETKDTLRAIMGRVQGETIEVLEKAPSSGSPYGHVSIRVGERATYDLVGAHQGYNLPQPLVRVTQALTGQSNLFQARKRNMRRFFESLDEAGSKSVYRGYLFSATREQIDATDQLYTDRRKEIKGFDIEGGSNGTFNCAQFLTENVPFLNDRAIDRTISAQGVVRSAQRSSALEAVVIYRMPGAPDPVASNQ
jgi:hypothetical protein